MLKQTIIIFLALLAIAFLGRAGYLWGIWSETCNHQCFFGTCNPPPASCDSALADLHTPFWLGAGLLVLTWVANLVQAWQMNQWGRIRGLMALPALCIVLALVAFSSIPGSAWATAAIASLVGVPILFYSGWLLILAGAKPAAYPPEP